MDELVKSHTRTLHVLAGAFLLSCVVYGLIIFLVPPPESPVLQQTRTVLWIFGALTILNLVTIMPVYRAMLAQRRKVYAVSREPQPLLAAHRAAHLVAFARLEFIAILGLLVFFITGRGDWFWFFNGVALVGMLALWPLREKVVALLEGERQTP